METMDLKTVLILLGLLVLTFTILWWVGKTNAQRIHKVYGTPIYARLCSFEYFVKECSITLENYNNITEELKEIRARNEMSDFVFCNKVNEIGQTFEKRFNEWIPTSEATKHTN